MTTAEYPVAERRTPGARTAHVPEPAPRWLVLTAFGLVYVLWGSTYLGIRIAIETIPPFLMAGVRFLIAGAILYAFARGRGAPRPERAHWRSAFIVGALLLVLSNGGVTWAEQTVPSGITSILVCIAPLWMVTLDWLFFGGQRPTLTMTFGLLLGLAGVIVLIGPDQIAHGGGVDPAGAAVLLTAPVFWCFGSLWSRQAPLPKAPILAIGMEMIGGGVILLVAAALTGELAHVDIQAISARSYAALAYLVVFGALIGFTAYLWLLRVTSAANVSTHSFVNPVIAVFLGWAIAGEQVTARTLAASGIIVAAVALITLARARASAH